MNALRIGQPLNLPLPNKVQVAILGATGLVGLQLARLIDGHPWFDLVAVGASERSAGRRFADVASASDVDVPLAVANLVVERCDPRVITAPLVFSALDAATAAQTEADFAKAGAIVVTNARHHRMDADVPLLIPEVNLAHLSLLDHQRRMRGWPGAIVANGNCAAIVVTLAVAALHRAFMIRRLMITTLQAVSGAGYPGVSSLDILGNIIPYIGGGEEERIETETPKMLGHLVNGSFIQPSRCLVSAQVTRVPVEHGHTACIAAEFERAPDPEEAISLLRNWESDIASLGLPSAPAQTLIISDAGDRPQPRRDANAGNGMSVTIGRVRRDSVLHLRLVATGHNLIRGAAGAALLNAEVLLAQGFVGSLSKRAVERANLGPTQAEPSRQQQMIR